MFRRSQTTPLAADEASFIGDDDNSKDDEVRLLTQPPSLLNTVRSPPSSGRDELSPSFLDSVRRVINDESQFTRRNATDDYITPPAPPLTVIPDFVSSAIKNELLLTWGCSTPRPYQIEAIFHLVYTKLDMMYLVRKTGEGKSLVLQGMASIFKGVTILMVPLLGLGSDQAEKTACATATTTIIESYHLDEFRNTNAIELRDRLNEYCRKEKTAIMLFVSPQQLLKHSFWHRVLVSLAERGCVSAVCVDEAHCAVHNYESFRPEFKAAIDSINGIVGIARRSNPDTFYVPILVMSATLTISDQRAFNRLICRLPTIVMWGDMSRRNISFSVDISGDPLNAFIKDWIAFTTLHPRRQSLVYSNTASSCDGSILNRLLAAQQKLPLSTGDILPFTGECGTMLKSYLMASFCGETMDAATPTDVQQTCLRKILCMPCTSAANCGVSSNNCSSCFRIGPPPSWHEMVQEMGRVDRLHTNSERESNSYKIYLNLPTFISLWCRIQAEVNNGVRARQLENLMDILSLLILPRGCYHDAIEKYFENPASYDSNPSCGSNCSFCDGSIMDICGKVSKSQLISLLTTRVFDKGNVSAMTLVSMITSKSNKRTKAAIWGGKKSITAGNAHALILMLIASKMVQLELPMNANPREHTPLRDVQLSLRKQFAHVDDEFETFSLYIDENWTHIQHSP